MSNSKKMRDDAIYERVKRRDPYTYGQICAFASVIGTHEDISAATRYEIERYCMVLCEQVTEELCQFNQAVRGELAQTKEAVTVLTLTQQLADVNDELGKWRRGLLTNSSPALQELEAQLARLTNRYKRLVTWADTQTGVPCEQIRHQQEAEALQAQLAQAQKELIAWKHTAKSQDALEDEITKLEYDLQYAKAALNSIRDAVLNGRSQLEGMAVDNDIINAVLGIIDDATADIDAARVVVEKGQPCVR